MVDVARAGINFADTHAIRDDYLAKQTLPLIPGGEVAGRTPDGRRVAALLASGGYAEKVAVPEAALVPVPDEVSDDQAAALLLQGLTARSLLRTSARLEPGESVVVEAAGGGTGSLAVQLAKRLGAGRVIALASSRVEARARAAPGRRRCRRLPRRRPQGRRSSRRTAASRSTSCSRCAAGLGVRRRASGAGPVRAPGHLRPRLARAERGSQRRSDADQPGVVGFWLDAPLHAARAAARGDRGAARRCRGRGARGRDRRRLSALRRAAGTRGHRAPERPTASSSWIPARFPERFRDLGLPEDILDRSTSSATSSRRRSRSRRSRSCWRATT